MSNQSFIPFGDPDYWENRYLKDPDPFEWYINFLDYEPEIAKYLSSSKHILQIGSELAQDLFDRNMKNQKNIDISKSVVEQMSQKNINIPYLQMDVKNMSFENNVFDIVMDKACLDCIFCGKHAFRYVDKALEQIHRVLKKDGYYFLLSNSPASLRLSFLEKYFKTTLVPVEKWWERHIHYDRDKELPKYLFLYICQKQ